MKPVFLPFLFLSQLLFAQNTISTANKNAVFASVEKHQQELIKLSDQIWGFAEIALRETKSSKVLADYAEAQGFRVTRGVAEIPTAFIAEFGSGKPIIGVLGEFDALRNELVPINRIHPIAELLEACWHYLDEQNGHIAPTPSSASSEFKRAIRSSDFRSGLE